MKTLWSGGAARGKCSDCRWVRMGVFWCVFLVSVNLTGAGAASAQAQDTRDFRLSGIGEGRREEPIREGLPDMRGGFQFCRLVFTTVVREPSGLGWSTDYPTGDENLLVRLSQLTTAQVGIWKDGTPGHAAVRATDPEIFSCPFLFASDLGSVGFSKEEVSHLRDYFLKGGFLWADDFWGERAWDRFADQIGRVLPDLKIVDIPSDHPILSLIYRVEKVPQIPNIGFWRRTGGQTSEFGAATAQVNFRGIFDDDGRLLVLTTHNTDIADAWEREGESDEFFSLFSPTAYGLAVNIALWVMTR